MRASISSSRVRAGSAIVFILLFASVAMIALVVANPEDVSYKLLALALFAACIYLGAKERHFFNPYYLFSLTPLSLTLYEYKFSTYYLDRLDPSTYGIALSGIAAFIVGLSLLRHADRSRPAVDVEVRENRLFYPLLLLGMLPIAYGITQAPGILLSGDILRMSEYVGLMPMSSVLMLLRYFALVLAIKSGQAQRIAVAACCNGFALALSFNKTNLVFLVFVLLISVQKYGLTTRRRKKAFAAVCIIAIVLIFASVTFYDSVRGDFDSTEALVRMGSSGLPRFLMLPYMYLVSSWTNLQYVMCTQPAHTLGLWLIRPLLFYFRIDGAFADSYALVPASSFNTYTYLVIPWKDFGVVGVVLISLGLGLFISYLYQRARLSRSPFFCAAYALNAVAVVEMFFSNHFFYLVYPFTALIVALLCDVYSGYATRDVPRSRRIVRSGRMLRTAKGER